MSAQPPSFTPRRLDAARHLLSPDHLLGSFALGRQPHLRNSLLAGLQAGLLHHTQKKPSQLKAK